MPFHPTAIQLAIFRAVQRWQVTGVAIERLNANGEYYPAGTLRCSPVRGGFIHAELPPCDTGSADPLELCDRGYLRRECLCVPRPEGIRYLTAGGVRTTTTIKRGTPETWTIQVEDGKYSEIVVEGEAAYTLTPSGFDVLDGVVDTPDDAEKKRRGATESPPTNLTGESLALAALVAHPEWSDTKIAAEVGCHRVTLYRWQKFKAARDAMKAREDAAPRGFKNADGDIESWE